MTPTLFMAWLSHPEDGGYFDPRMRADEEPQDFRSWRKHGPLHLSLHTRRDRAEAALRAAAETEWEQSKLANTWGPFAETADPLNVMVRHIGYDAHVTEQPVDLP